MPSLITHQIFANKIYQKLDKNIKKNISVNHLYTFTQSHDLLYFYSSLNKKKQKKVNKFGHYVHKANTQSYLINIVRNIKDLKLEYNQEAISYLYGAISHYVLDSTAHPYIFYKTGKYVKDKKKTKKYQGLHNHLEKHLDIFYYQETYHKNIKELNIKKEILPKIVFSKKLKELIDKSYKQSYNKDDMSKLIFAGYKKAIQRYTIFSQDKYGIKNFIYSIISFIIYQNKLVLSNYSYYNKKLAIEYLNLKKEKWHHPSTYQEFNFSFIELFELAETTTLNIINEVNKVLYNNQSPKTLSQIIPNVSYLSGLPINNNLPLKYFEF